MTGSLFHAFPERAERPLAGGFVMTQNIGIAIACGHLEVAVVRREPAVLDRRYLEPPVAERKGARLLFAAVAGVTFDLNFHRHPVKPG